MRERLVESPVESKRGVRLLLELGRGGMGVVYLALAVGPGGFTKLKVIKRLRPDIADEPRARQMFLDEAKLAARLLHPNIVQTNEVGFDGKHYFMEMEYLEGQSFDALLRRAEAKGASVPLSAAIWVLTQTLEGLHHAHELVDLDGKPLHVVHRDVSPHNVLVTYDGNVKVLDFGIAKAADTQGETTTGAVKGKATYMAPEQAARKPADRRADLFAVGVMLWQALAGQRLWAGLSDFQIFLKLHEGAIPKPSSIRPDVSPELEAICMRAVAKDPADRYATAADFQAALDSHLESSGARVGPKTLAKLMTELFAEKRAQVRAEIEAQIKGSPSEVKTFDIPAIADVGTAPLTGTGVGQTRTTSAYRESTTVGRKNRALRRMILAALALAVTAGAATGVVALRARAKRNAEAAAQASASAALAAARECETNATCVKSHDGKPWICKKDQGKCVALESDECTVLAEPGDVENDRTVWIGTMFPTTGPKASTGIVMARGVDLGRRDFLRITKGIPSQRPGAPPRPLGIVSCDDSQQSERSAKHLTEEIGLPLVIGFGNSQEVVDLATSLFIPHDVLAIASVNQSPLITSITQPSGQARLVWRTVLSSAQFQLPVSLIVPTLLEPRIRAAHTLGPDEAVRVALLRPSTTLGASLADGLLINLRFNGKTAVENGDNFHDFAFNDVTKPDEAAKLVQKMLTFRPHVVVYVGEGELVKAVFEPIESAWPNGTVRPYFVGTSGLVEELFPFIGKDADRRHRYFGVSQPSKTTANARLVMRYNEAYEEATTASLSPGGPYDAVYLAAYAAFVVGETPLSGPSLAGAFARFQGPGARIDVGPAGIQEVIDGLRGGGNVDLVGTVTTLDFDPQTGEAPGDFVVMCVGVDPSGKANDGIDSGVFYDGREKRLTGKLECP